MKKLALAVAAVAVALGAAQACVMYVEVPKPYTKKDFVDGVNDPDKYSSRYAAMFAAMDEAARAHMKAIGDPDADYILIPTKNGEVIHPFADRPKAAETPAGEITYARGDGWADTDWAQANKHIEGAYPLVKAVYGQPRGSGRTVQVHYDPTAPNSYYVYWWPIYDDIVLNYWNRDEGPGTLTHEMTHSFHYDLCIEYSHFEEGFAEAVTHAVMNLMVEEPGEYGETWHHSADMEIHYTDFYNEFQFNQNMPGIETRCHSFSSEYAVGGPVMSFYRYKAAGYAWWKVFRVDRDFFIDFNDRYYDDPTDTFSELQDIARAAYDGGPIEGLSFADWLNRQTILNIPPAFSDAMFLSVLDTQYRFWFYSRSIDGQGNEVETGFPGQIISFDLYVAGLPQGSQWNGETGPGGGIGGMLPLPSDGVEHRFRLRAYHYPSGFARTSFGWWSTEHIELNDLELYGATTGLLDGSIRLVNLETGDSSSVPVYNGGFHFEKFAVAPGEPESGSGPYAAQLYDVNGSPVKTAFVCKDCADYFILINDVDLAAGAASAETPALPPAKCAFAVSAPAPNPASTSTTIRVTLSEAADVDVAVFDLAGRRVALAFAGRLGPGVSNVAINTAALPAGVYIYRVAAGANVAARKLVVAR